MTVEMRLRRLLAAARQVVDPSSSVGQHARTRWRQLGILSDAGLELALTHLEVDASSGELSRLRRWGASGSSFPKRCHVLLASNVCTAPLRALACALAVASHVCVRASRRDPVLAECLIELLAADPDFTGHIEQVAEICPHIGDEVHLYGSDETMEQLTRGWPKDIIVKRHGTGLGVVLVEHPTGVSAQTIARSLLVFDGRGCLSPRLVFCPAAEELAELIDAALAELAKEVPRTLLSTAEQAELAAYGRLFESLGRVWQQEHHLVACDPEPSRVILPPAQRALLVVQADAESMPQLLTPLAQYVTVVAGALGSAMLLCAKSLCPQARVVDVSNMQRPPLDGPVDLRAPAC